MPNFLSFAILFFALTFVEAVGQDAPKEFRYPLAVIATADGIVYVADRSLPGIWKVEGGQKSVYFQGSQKFRTPLNAVRCLAIDHEGKLLAGDSSTRDVYRFDNDGTPQPLTNGWIGQIQKVTPDGRIEPFIKGHPFSLPHNIVRIDDGSFFVTDNYQHCVCPAVKKLTVLVRSPAER